MSHHYYAACVYCWVCGETEDEVIKKLAREVGKQSIENSVNNNGGLLVYTCRVEADIKAHYQIRSFMPTGVEISEVKEFRILNAAGKRKETTSEFI